MRYTLLLTAAVCVAGAIAFAQDPVLPAANVEALFKDNNAKLNENKQVAYHIERDLRTRPVFTLPESSSCKTGLFLKWLIPRALMFVHLRGSLPSHLR